MAVFDVIIPQSPAATRQTILSTTNGTAVTTSGSAGPFPVDFFSSACITTAVSTCSGTISFYLQKLLPDGTSWDDIACITSLTSSIETKSLSFVNGGNSIVPLANQTTAAGTIRTVNFGAYWRVSWSTGTTATNSHAFAIYGDFFA